MTIRLLVDYGPYKVGNLITLDANTEAALVALKMGDTNLAGGTAYLPPGVTASAQSVNKTYGTLVSILATPPARGALFFTTDTQTINGALGGGNDWIGDGTQWRPLGWQRIYADTTVVGGVLQTAEQVLKSISIPAGLLYKQRFEVQFVIAKTGATDVLNLASLRFGSTGTVADPQLVLSGTAYLAAGKRAAGSGVNFESVSATSIQRRGTPGQVDNSSWSGQASTLAVQTAIAVPDHQVGVCKLSVTAGMATAAADIPQAGETFITLVP